MAATRTAETKFDVPADHVAWHGLRSWLAFAGIASCVGLAGLALAETADELSRKTSLSQTTIGAVFTAITTSLPELVTSIAAVRQGARTLALGGIIGGNALDVLFLAFADVAYRGGSIYHAMIERHVFLLALTIAMTASCCGVCCAGRFTALRASASKAPCSLRCMLAQWR